MLVDLRGRTLVGAVHAHDAAHDADPADAGALFTHAVARHDLARRGVPAQCPEGWRGDVMVKSQGAGGRMVSVNGDSVELGPGEWLVLPESGGLRVGRPSFDVAKTDMVRRFTLSAWYIPDRVDAHGEWTSPDELQQAAWRYVRRGDRTIMLQHDQSVRAGEFVEIVTLPWPVTVPKLDPDSGRVAAREYPAGTVLLGVVWDEWAWDLVTAGRIRGLSMAGSGIRVEVG